MTPPPEEIDRAKAPGFVHGVKLYPAGATTHSDAGVTDIRKVYARARRAWRSSACRCWCTARRRGADVDVFDRETHFIDTRARAAARALSSACAVVFEHITTARAVEFVAARAQRRRRHHHAPAPAAQSQRDFLRRHPAALLLPADPEARAGPRKRCSRAATSGNPRFFLGTDSAPHERATKENCLRLRRHVHRPRGASSCTPRRSKRPAGSIAWKAFASHFGADFYGLPRHADTHHAGQGALDARRSLRVRRRHAGALSRRREPIAWRLAGP